MAKTAVADCKVREIVLFFMDNSLTDNPPINADPQKWQDYGLFLG